MLYGISSLNLTLLLVHDGNSCSRFTVHTTTLLAITHLLTAPLRSKSSSCASRISPKLYHCLAPQSECSLEPSLRPSGLEPGGWRLRSDTMNDFKAAPRRTRLGRSLAQHSCSWISSQVLQLLACLFDVTRIVLSNSFSSRALVSAVSPKDFD